MDKRITGPRDVTTRALLTDSLCSTHLSPAVFAALWTHDSSGVVFICRNCIAEWCNEKPECPLCRAPITHSELVCLYNADF